MEMDDKMTFHLSRSLLPLVRILAMNLHFLDGLALPSALSLLFGKPPSLWGCMNITQHERNSPLISAHNLPMQRTPYATYTHTHKYRSAQATPWGSVLRCNFLSIKISFLSCRFHNNATW